LSRFSRFAYTWIDPRMTTAHCELSPDLIQRAYLQMKPFANTCKRTITSSAQSHGEEC
jgi:hypothetical protein